MAQSPEYPDLKWVQPRSWTNDDRTKSDIKWIVIHTTQGSAHGTSAEDGAAYNQKRTDGTSAHYFVDNNSVVHCVRTQDRAHTARATGNRYGIQYEFCGRAEWSRSTWLNAYGRAMLARAAKQIARDVEKYDIPIRRLSTSQVASKQRGFCGHNEITDAFPQDKGTHWDPGPNFPYDVLFDLVRDELAPEPEEDELPDAKQVAQAVADHQVWNPYSKKYQKLSEIWGWTPSASWHQTTHAMLDALIKLVTSKDAENDEVAAERHAEALALIEELRASLPVPEPEPESDAPVQP